MLHSRFAKYAVLAFAIGDISCGSAGTGSGNTGFGNLPSADDASVGAMGEAGSTASGPDGSKNPTGTLVTGMAAKNCLANTPDQAGCACTQVGATRACYTGPADARGVGACKDGTQTCVRHGEFAAYGPCTGEGFPPGCASTDPTCRSIAMCSCVALPSGATTCPMGMKASAGGAACCPCATNELQTPACGCTAPTRTDSGLVVCPLGTAQSAAGGCCPCVANDCNNAASRPACCGVAVCSSLDVCKVCKIVSGYNGNGKFPDGSLYCEGS